MSEKSSYKHIRVTPAVDDDIVVVAGVVEASNGEVAEATQVAGEAMKAVGAAGEAGRVAGIGSASAEVAEPASAAREAAKVAATEREQASAATAKGAAPASAADDVYRETTLDDIEQSKMPVAQLVVIGVSLVCLAAFIIWYNFF